MTNLRQHVWPKLPFRTVLADPPWRFNHRRGKVSPEHKRLNRYETMTMEQIKALPVEDIVPDEDEQASHLYLWCPNSFLPQGLEVMESWGFQYKSNLIWHKIRKDGGSDGRGCGFYFRNVTEVLLFGVRGKSARTREAGRRQVNFLASRKREHSRKPDEIYPLIEACSHWPYAELFARETRRGWFTWGDQIRSGYNLHLGQSEWRDLPVMLGEYEVGSIAHEPPDEPCGAFHPICDSESYHGATVNEVLERMAWINR